MIITRLPNQSPQAYQPAAHNGNANRRNEEPLCRVLARVIDCVVFFYTFGSNLFKQHY